MGMTEQPDILGRIRGFVDQEHLLDGVARLHVGFSGGADSTALLCALAQLHPQLTAVHLHHGLRGIEADHDANWCREFCARRGVPFRLEKLDVPAAMRAGESVESAARRCRLHYWRETVPSGDAVALGHHTDDALETFFLRLARGANATGLTGLRPSRVLGGVRILRPLLSLRRRDIETFLHQQGVDDWCEDSSNQDRALRRNLIRHEWLPMIRAGLGQDDGILRTMARLADDADFLETCAEAQRHAVRSAAALRDLHPALLPRVLRMWLRQETGRDIVPRGAGVDRLRDAVRQDPAGDVEIPLGGGVGVVLSRDGLRLMRDTAPMPVRQWRWSSQPTLCLPECGTMLVAKAEGAVTGKMEAEGGEWFAADSLPPCLIVRSWHAGDRMVPFGRRTPKKLKGLFTDARVGRLARMTVPVLAAGDNILWVPGVCRAEIGRIAGPGPVVFLGVSTSPAVPGTPAGCGEDPRVDPAGS